MTFTTLGEAATAVVEDVEWRFWRAQLAAQSDPTLEPPEIDLDQPAQTGFYMIVNSRSRTYNDAADRRPGDPRTKISVSNIPVAFWRDGPWIMLIGRERWSRDPLAIESTFARCCRNAIEHSEYERLRYETVV